MRQGKQRTSANTEVGQSNRRVLPYDDPIIKGAFV